MSEEAAQAWDANRDLGISQLQEHGFEFRQPSDELMQGFNDAAQMLHEEWITTNEAKGLPAQEAYDWVMDNMESYK